MYHFLTVSFPDSQKLRLLFTDYVLHVPQNKQSTIPILLLFDRACLLCKEDTEFLDKIWITIGL